MHIKFSNSTRSHRHVFNSNSDFTVQDFANTRPNQRTTARLKKNATQSFKINTMNEKENEELAWYEKDLSDFDWSDPEETKEETPTRKSRRGKRRDDKTTLDENDNVGMVYSVDIWFLIGDHVHPESLKQFAGICHGTHVVTHSARFWINMYRRYLMGETASKTLPYELSQSSMQNLHGLRCRVIRALFLLYDPFQQRIKAIQPFGQDPDILRGHRCCLYWYKEDKNMWYFYFKFHNPHLSLCHFKGDVSTVRTRRKRDLLDDDNIHHNAEEGNHVLQVVSQNFIPIPVVMGETLTKVLLTLGASMRYHKLKLEFNDLYQASGTNAVIIDPVLNLQVFPWWHPAYPCHSSVS